MNQAGCDDDVAQKVREGDPAALAELFTRNRDRLRALVRLRMDRRLAVRVDPADIVQEAFLDASRRLDDYAANPAMPPYLWVRFLTVQRLLMAHRQNIGAQARDAGREVALNPGSAPEASSQSLAIELVGRLTSPTRAAVKTEIQKKIQEALDALEPLDREILTLRHFEELNNNEAAAVLGLQKSAASNRYVRALSRLKAVLAQCPELHDEK
jgi:RNA polymerase sigma-70 factor (ECF subfamily)